MRPSRLFLVEPPRLRQPLPLGRDGGLEAVRVGERSQVFEHRHAHAQIQQFDTAREKGAEPRQAGFREGRPLHVRLGTLIRGGVARVGYWP